MYLYAQKEKFICGFVKYFSKTFFQKQTAVNTITLSCVLDDAGGEWIEDSCRPKPFLTHTYDQGASVADFDFSDGTFFCLKFSFYIKCRHKSFLKSNTFQNI